MTQKKTGTFEMRSGSHVQFAALRNRDFELQTRHHFSNGQQRAFAIKMFYKNNDSLDFFFSKVPVFLCHPVYSLSHFYGVH